MTFDGADLALKIDAMHLPFTCTVGYMWPDESPVLRHQGAKPPQMPYRGLALL